MRWFKVAAIVVGVMIAFLVVSSVVGFVLEAVIAVLAVAAIVLGVKVAFNRKHAVRNGAHRGVRRPTRSAPLRGHNTPDVDEELARLKSETDR